MLSASSTGAVSGGDYNLTFSYDAVRNILNKSDVGSYTYAGNTGSNYANPHAVTSVGSNSFTYDNDGNMTSGDGLTNTWDYRNRLTQSTMGAKTIAYAYDANNNRVKYSNGTTTTIYANKFYDVEGTTSIKHILTGDDTVATVKGTGTSAKVYPVHTDHLSGTNVVSNTIGGVEEVADYLPYGAQRFDEQNGTFSEQKKFAGKTYDADTKLSYFGARYYDASIGRFTSEDPAFLAVGDSGQLKQKTGIELATYLSDPQGMNSYSYARNNPMRYVDTKGEWYADVLTGNQSLSSFQGEVGMAANQLYQDSPGWKFALDNPVATGVIVAAASYPALVAGGGIDTAYQLATYPGVGASFIAQNVAVGAAYSTLVVGSTLAIPGIINTFGKANYSNPSSIYSAALSITEQVAPSFTGSFVGAITDAGQFGTTVANGIVNLGNKIFGR